MEIDPSVDLRILRIASLLLGVICTSFGLYTWFYWEHPSQIVLWTGFFLLVGYIFGWIFDSRVYYT